MIVEKYRYDNARKVNAKKHPDGYLYILAMRDFHIYKVGVSNNPKRRIADIRANMPFDVDVIFLMKFKDVYDIEKIVLDGYEKNKIKGEWFNAYADCINETIAKLKSLHYNENKKM